MKKSVIAGIFVFSVVFILLTGFALAAWPFTGKAVSGTGKSTTGSGNTIYDLWEETDNGNEPSDPGIVAYTTKYGGTWKWNIDYCTRDAKSVVEYYIEDRGDTKTLKSYTHYCSNGCLSVPLSTSISPNHPGFDLVHYQAMANTNPGYCAPPPSITNCESTDNGIRVSYSNNRDEEFRNRCTGVDGSGVGRYPTNYECDGITGYTKVTDDEACDVGSCYMNEGGMADCIEPVVTGGIGRPVQPMCTETGGEDGRKDVRVRGTATSSSGYSGTDSCLSNSRVLEFYCPTNPSNNRIYAQSRVCPRGTTCQNGACATPTTPTTPTTTTPLITNGLQLYLPFSSSASRTNDYSGGQRHGTCSVSGTSVVCPDLNPTGKTGSAVKFNANGQAIKFSSLPHNNKISVAAWVKFDRFGTSQTWEHIVTKRTCCGNDNGQIEWSLQTDNNGRILAAVNDGTSVKWVTATTIVSDTRSPTGAPVWTHLTFTYDGANLGIYVNGRRERTTQTATNANIRQLSNVPVYVGAIMNNNFGTGSASTMMGSVDEVYIFNRALSSSEIATLAGRDLVVS